MGAVYLQDAVCVLPARPDLVENMQYVAESVQELGGTAHLFEARSLLPEGSRLIQDELRAHADNRLDEIVQRLERIQAALDRVADTRALEQVEEEVRRERVAFLRAMRLAYCGSTREGAVEERLDTLMRSLDDLYRSEK